MKKKERAKDRNPVESFKNNVESCDGITFKEAVKILCTGGGVAYTYSWKDMVKAFNPDLVSSSQPDSTIEQSTPAQSRSKEPQKP